MEHPGHLNEAERIIRFQAAQIANAKDLDRLQGSTSQHRSALNEMYENYFDGVKDHNINNFKIMKNVDK